MVQRLKTLRMACGHAPHEDLESGQPVCSTCLGLDPRALVPAVTDEMRRAGVYTGAGEYLGLPYLDPEP